MGGRSLRGLSGSLFAGVSHCPPCPSSSARPPNTASSHQHVVQSVCRHSLSRLPSVCLNCVRLQLLFLTCSSVFSHVETFRQEAQVQVNRRCSCETLPSPGLRAPMDPFHALLQSVLIILIKKCRKRSISLSLNLACLQSSARPAEKNQKHSVPPCSAEFQ